MQEGADADVVVFDPSTIQDRSTYAKPSEASTGVQFLVVNGVVLIDGGKLVEGIYPGQAIVGTAARP